MKKTFLRAVFLKKETLTSRLLQVVDDYEIYSSLIGEDIELGEVINSPLRSSDECPSFAIFIPTKLIDKGYDIRPDEVWFKDMATGYKGNVFTFVKYYAMHHFGEKLAKRYDVIKFIDRQLALGMFTASGPVRVSKKREYEKRALKDISYKSRKFTKRDLEYWAKLEQTKEDLEFWGVKSVRYLLNENNVVRKEFRRNELAYVYEIWDKCKLYQPEAARTFKFRNTCPGDDHRYYQGYRQITGEPRILIITKSMKDVMVFHKFFNKYLGIPVDVMAPHAESIKLSDAFIKGINHYYDLKICVSDFDLAGVKFARHCRSHGFVLKFVDTKRVSVNGKLKVIDKDLSDYLTNHGRVKTENKLKEWDLNKLLKTHNSEKN